MEKYDKIFDWYCAARNPDAGVEPIRLFAQKLQPGATVLDVGCGNGVPVTGTLLKLGFKPFGIDSSIKMVASLREKFPAIPVQHSDVLNSDFFQMSFDAVVGYGFMFHLTLDQQKIAIEKVAEHLKPEGYFFFNSGNEDGSKMTPPEYNGGESFLMSSMSRIRYEKIMQRHQLVLLDHYVEEGFGSTIYIAKKTVPVSQISVIEG